jgi:hypothetical protein
MSFEKYGNKLIRLLSRIEEKLDPAIKSTHITQVGGGDGPDGDDSENSYVKVLSYSVNHVSVLVHLEKDSENNAKVLELPQIVYDTVNEYSIEQQLRLGCDKGGQMYKYSIVLTRPLKNTKSTAGDGTVST